MSGYLDTNAITIYIYCIMFAGLVNVGMRKFL
nr:MAG TPA_asm: Photosynthetic reaction centre, H-chain N-terminal region [Caudoviricetes sp.]